VCGQPLVVTMNTFKPSPSAHYRCHDADACHADGGGVSPLGGGRLHGPPAVATDATDATDAAAAAAGDVAASGQPLPCLLLSVGL